MDSELRAWLTQTPEGHPAVVLHNLPLAGELLTPAQLEALAVALLAAAQDASAMASERVAEADAPSERRYALVSPPPGANYQLTAVSRSINADMAAQSKMAVGREVMHPDGYLVKVLSGTYLDPVNGRVANFWSWARVNPDGSLGKVEHGYGW